MSKTAKISFWVFNILYFGFTWILLPYVPNPIIFGWIPLQLFLIFGLPVIAAIVWGLYFKGFFRTQDHVDKLLKDKGEAK